MAIDDSWATTSATELAAAVRDKAISARELLDLYLDRIERLNGPVNAVVTLDIERARGAAGAADDATARGDAPGPLHGLPVTIKDAIATEGIRSTGGAVELRDHVPAEDAPAVTRLKEAGAIVFGKTNLPRWSGDLQTFNEIFGTTNNPWDATRAPGGSSGGAAAAVACGFTSFELGTDIGGSLRNPAHFCGVFSLKPSFGVVPQRGYLDHRTGGTIDADINVFGPLARSADDLDLLLDVLAGPEPERAPAWRLELPGPTVTTAAGARVAVWFDDEISPIDNGYRALLQRTADALADAGAKVEVVKPPVPPHEQQAVFFSMISAAISPSFDDAIADELSGSHRAWLRAEEQRAAMRETWARWFVDYDVLLCPVTPTGALPHDQEHEFFDRVFAVNGVERPFADNVIWNGLIGILGLPSAVPPIGRVEGNLPVGIQVVAPYLHDRTSNAVARIISEQAGGYEPPPGF
jgi:amidase